ncbi:MAG: pyrroline-5-carboxylate reductase [Hyphomicrobiales bacterium]|nr:MAG: pyrroline-5-carboxylate reductase [Hyphomicrobiales bacterium]
MQIELDGKLLLVGAGNMGLALLSGWIARGLPASQVIVQDPSPPPAALEFLGKHGIVSKAAVEPSSTPIAVVLMAVKPQIMADVLPGIAGHVGPKTVVLSIAAGKTIASFERALPAGAAVVRAMPNTPASVGRGITVAVPNAHVTPAQRAACEGLLAAVGEVAWTSAEGDLDAVTGVSGSGPAYVFYLAECMTAAGIAQGLSPDLAQKLARWTVAGAGELLHRSPLGADTLRQNVTSPNGTTYAALQVLMAEDGMRPLLVKAIEAATRRSRELAS